MTHPSPSPGSAPGPAPEPSLPRRLSEALVTASAPLCGAVLIALAVRVGLPKIPAAALLVVSLATWGSGCLLLFRFFTSPGREDVAHLPARARFYAHARIAYAGLFGLVLTPVGLVGVWIGLFEVIR